MHARRVTHLFEQSRKLGYSEMRKRKNLELLFHAPNAKGLLIFIFFFVRVLEAELPAKRNFTLDTQQANVFL